MMYIPAGERVSHRVTKASGTVISSDICYTAVIFDGDPYPSTVATDSLHRDQPRTQG